MTQTLNIRLNFYSSSSGINIFLDGFVPTENLRFRETSLVFKVSETADKVMFKRTSRILFSKEEYFYNNVN